MLIFGNPENLRRCVIASILAVVTAGLASAAGTSTPLLEQPLESGIANNVFVADVDKVPLGSWEMVIGQKSPYTATGRLVTTAWNAGSQTGFTPVSPSTAQVGYRNKAGTSTVQMEDGTVGAYLNSSDLPTSLTEQNMVFSPQYKWPAGAAPVAFSQSTSVLNAELELQVPTADGKATCVKLDLLFLDPSGTHILFGVQIFCNEAPGAVVRTFYSPLEGIYKVNAPLATGQQFLSLTTGSMTKVGVPWSGYRHVQFSINPTQFSAAIKYLMSQYPGKLTLYDPTQYVLSQVRLDAEFHYSTAPAEI